MVLKRPVLRTSEFGWNHYSGCCRRNFTDGTRDIVINCHIFESELIFRPVQCSITSRISCCWKVRWQGIGIIRHTQSIGSGTRMAVMFSTSYTCIFNNKKIRLNVSWCFSRIQQCWPLRLIVLFVLFNNMIYRVIFVLSCMSLFILYKMNAPYTYSKTCKKGNVHTRTYKFNLIYCRLLAC